MQNYLPIILNGCLFLLAFALAYYVVLLSNFEKLFKQGQITAIRIGQVLLALIIAYFITSAIASFLPTQFKI